MRHPSLPLHAHPLHLQYITHHANHGTHPA
jgi:hypothetical protein